MSKVVTSDVPTGYQIISCTAYSDRIANLAEGTINYNVVGFPYDGSANSKWTFDKQGTSGSEYKIATTAAQTSGTPVVYASSPDPVPGEKIYGASSATTYNVEPLAEDEGNYRISIKSSSGTVLYWTLDNDNEGTAITLEEDDGTSIQIWAIYEPSS